MTKIIDIEDAESMNKINLRPCPFCGSHRARLYKAMGFWSVYCYKCLAATDDYNTQAQAYNAWNARDGELDNDHAYSALEISTEKRSQ